MQLNRCATVDFAVVAAAADAAEVVMVAAAAAAAHCSWLLLQLIPTRARRSVEIIIWGSLNELVGSSFPQVIN